MIVMRQTAGGVVVDGKLIPLRVDENGAQLPEPAAPSVEDEDE